MFQLDLPMTATPVFWHNGTSSTRKRTACRLRRAHGWNVSQTWQPQKFTVQTSGSLPPFWTAVSTNNVLIRNYHSLCLLATHIFCFPHTWRSPWKTPNTWRSGATWWSWLIPFVGLTMGTLLNILCFSQCLKKRRKERSGLESPSLNSHLMASTRIQAQFRCMASTRVSDDDNCLGRYSWHTPLSVTKNK